MLADTRPSTSEIDNPKELSGLLDSDIAKKVLRQNKAFFSSWWKTWQEWNRKNVILLEMIKEEKEKQLG